jgi:GTP-binding protein HflX
VELAQLRYRLPRLSGRGRSLSRQGGGIGTRGPGETQLEKDRRAIARRLQRLQRDVERLGAHRARLRQRRSGLRRLALVGYTNAGKSSLLNALTGTTGGAGVLAADRPFSTLDPTTRRIALGRPAEGRAAETLLTDTVGFIRDLPPQLIEAFRSTIEEALEAEGLLVVVDLSDPAWPEQLATVHRLLDQLGSGVPRLVIGNQIDRCAASELDRARVVEPAIRFVSATAGLGLAGPPASNRRPGSTGHANICLCPNRRPWPCNSETPFPTSPRNPSWGPSISTTSLATAGWFCSPTPRITPRCAPPNWARWHG